MPLLIHKAGNIMVVDGHPKIIDFGSAFVMEDGACSVESDKSHISTVHYRAPELLRVNMNGKRVVTPAADVWSYG